MVLNVGSETLTLKNKFMKISKVRIFVVYIVGLGFIAGGSDPNQVEGKSDRNHQPGLDDGLW